MPPLSGAGPYLSGFLGAYLAAQERNRRERESALSERGGALKEMIALRGLAADEEEQAREGRAREGIAELMRAGGPPPIAPLEAALPGQAPPVPGAPGTMVQPGAGAPIRAGFSAAEIPGRAEPRPWESLAPETRANILVSPKGRAAVETYEQIETSRKAEQRTREGYAAERKAEEALAKHDWDTYWQEKYIAADRLNRSQERQQALEARHALLVKPEERKFAEEDRALLDPLTRALEADPTLDNLIALENVFPKLKSASGRTTHGDYVKMYRGKTRDLAKQKQVRDFGDLYWARLTEARASGQPYDHVRIGRQALAGIPGAAGAILSDSLVNRTNLSPFMHKILQIPEEIDLSKLDRTFQVYLQAEALRRKTSWDDPETFAAAHKEWAEGRKRRAVEAEEREVRERIQAMTTLETNRREIERALRSDLIDPEVKKSLRPRLDAINQALKEHQDAFKRIRGYAFTAPEAAPAPEPPGPAETLLQKKSLEEMAAEERQAVVMDVMKRLWPTRQIPYNQLSEADRRKVADGIDALTAKVRAAPPPPAKAIAEKQPVPVAPTPKMPPKPSEPTSEAAFRSWYATWAQRTGINPDPDDPRHFYDYRAAFRAGAEPRIDPRDNQFHWPSAFKMPGHPTYHLKESAPPSSAAPPPTPPPPAPSAKVPVPAAPPTTAPAVRAPVPPPAQAMPAPRIPAPPTPIPAPPAIPPIPAKPAPIRVPPAPAAGVLPLSEKAKLAKTLLEGAAFRALKPDEQLTVLNDVAQARFGKPWNALWAQEGEEVMRVIGILEREARGR